MRAMPFDMPNALADAAWRNTPVLPVAYSDTVAMLKRMVEALTRFVLCGREEDAAVASLAGSRAISIVGAFADAAMQVQAAHDLGVTLAAADPAWTYLATGGDMPDSAAGMPVQAQPPPRAFLRRLARLSALNRAATLPRALIAPRHVAVTHNHLLADVARRGPGGIAFHHAPTLLAKGRAMAPERGEDSTDLARRLVAACLSTVALREPYAGRLAGMAARAMTLVVRDAASDLAGLRSVARLPSSIWAGTGGAYPTRALALEVRRRGGEVTLFDHGGCSGMFQWAETFCLSELSLPTRFVAMTEPAADNIRGLAHALPAAARPEIIGHDGDPTFAAMTALPPRQRRDRPRVVYPLGPFYGFRQWYPPLFPDPIYYDFMMRTAAQLSAMPFAVVAKPRPAAGGRHPVQAVLTADFRPFEEVLPESDVALFDDVHSTTFWETACSDRGMVAIDLGYDEFTPDIGPLIHSRCRFVKARFNAHNIPRVDSNELAEALNWAATTQPDPRPIRRLIARAEQPGRAVLL